MIDERSSVAQLSQLLLQLGQYTLGFGVAELFRFPGFSAVAEAIKAFGGHRSALEMLDAFGYPKF